MIKIPDFKEPGLTRFFLDLLLDLDRKEKDVLSSVTGNRSVLLYSPSKYVFEITISDAGILTATKVSG